MARIPIYQGGGVQGSLLDGSSLAQVGNSGKTIAGAAGGLGSNIQNAAHLKNNQIIDAEEKQARLDAASLQVEFTNRMSGFDSAWRNDPSSSERNYVEGYKAEYDKVSDEVLGKASSRSHKYLERNLTNFYGNQLNRIHNVEAQRVANNNAMKFEEVVNSIGVNIELGGIRVNEAFNELNELNDIVNSTAFKEAQFAVMQTALFTEARNNPEGLLASLDSGKFDGFALDKYTDAKTLYQVRRFATSELKKVKNEIKGRVEEHVNNWTVNIERGGSVDHAYKTFSKINDEMFGGKQDNIVNALAPFFLAEGKNNIRRLVNDTQEGDLLNVINAAKNAIFKNGGQGNTEYTPESIQASLDEYHKTGDFVHLLRSVPVEQRESVQGAYLTMLDEKIQLRRNDFAEFVRQGNPEAFNKATELDDRYNLIRDTAESLGINPSEISVMTQYEAKNRAAILNDPNKINENDQFGAYYDSLPSNVRQLVLSDLSKGGLFTASALALQIGDSKAREWLFNGNGFKTDALSEVEKESLKTEITKIMPLVNEIVGANSDLNSAGFLRKGIINAFSKYWTLNPDNARNLFTDEFNSRIDVVSIGNMETLVFHNDKDSNGNQIKRSNLINSARFVQTEAGANKLYDFVSSVEFFDIGVRDAGLNDAPQTKTQGFIGDAQNWFLGEWGSNAKQGFLNAFQNEDGNSIKFIKADNGIDFYIEVYPKNSGYFILSGANDKTGKYEPLTIPAAFMNQSRPFHKTVWNVGVGGVYKYKVLQKPE